MANSSVLFVRLTIVVMVTLSQMLSSQGACPEQCTCDSVLKVVDCSNAGLTRIPIDLPDPVGLRELDLSGNKINEIIQEIVMYSNLELLDLSDNEMLSIDEDVLDSLPQLKYLYLQNNRLSSLTSRTLQGFDNLIKLDLSHNMLELLPDNVFADLNKLEDLNLASNAIQEIKDDAFVGLASLQYLYLTDNKLTAIPSRALEHVPKLSILYMDFNEVESIPTHAFKSMKELRQLNMEANGLMHISEYAFHEHGSASVPRLEILSLKSNKLECVPSVALQHLVHLISLDLSGNLIEMMQPDVLKGLDNLRSVYFNSMPELKVVQKYALSELAKLQIVEMHSNRKLTVVEEGAFLASSQIRRVDLHANNLQSLSANLFDWEGLSRVDLRYNPWRCDCHLKWMKSFLENLKSNISASLAGQVSCEGPERIASKKIVHIKDSDFVCKNKPDHQFEDHIMIAIFGVFSGVLLIVMLCLLIKNDYFVCHKDHRQMNYQVHKNCANPVAIRIEQANGHIVGNDVALVDNEEQDIMENQA